MLRTTMPQRVVSVVLAATLACTMVPANSLDSLAYAAEDVSNTNSETAVQDSSDDDAIVERPSDILSATYPITDTHGESDAQKSAGADQVSDSASPAADANAQSGTPASKDGLDIMSSTVALGDAASTVFTYNGLTYLENDDDENTVALVGWSDEAPEGVLEVPAKVMSGDREYSVSAMKIAGGGIRL